MNRISFNIIVRDGLIHGSNILRTLNSVRECADEFVVVDTGSTDGTPRQVRQWARRTGAG